MARILAVDDSRSMRQVVTATLENEGHDVAGAGDGLEGLEQAKSHPFDLVITDVNMPNMDGLTFIRELRGLEAYRFTPILVLTTESGTDTKAEGRQAGATGWLVKPFHPDDLVAVIHRVLG